jgi:hypothetical protein
LNLFPYLRTAGIIFGFLIISQSLFAQCAAPAALWLNPPHTSTEFILGWAESPGAEQYDIRYWASSNPNDKTVVENCGPAPFSLKGLKKNTPYTVEIRAKCQGGTSAWGASLEQQTMNSSGNCNLPLNPQIALISNEIQVSWTSSGRHTVRYRQVGTEDWLIPSGALSIANSPIVISGLAAGTYEVGLKRNCSGTSSDYFLMNAVIAGACPTPASPVVLPGSNSAQVNLPAQPGITAYQVEFRVSAGGNWTAAGSGVTPGNFLLTNLQPSTAYDVRVQAVCLNGSSNFSPVSSFTTSAQTTCLANKNAGKYMDAAAIQQTNQHFNQPSPHTFGAMIGVNDGGLVFRSFQTVSDNQITRLTTRFRNFHTMDEDFDASLTDYVQNIKPKDTQPEGTPSNMQYNKGLYSIYRQHGFLEITAATELLQYHPQTWKEKMYRESDWSAAGPAGISEAFKNYTLKFIDEFAAPGQQQLASAFQVGNEPWDYPFVEDYQSLLTGARAAFVSKYGPKSAGNWKMKLVVGAFQAYRDHNCDSYLRDFSNCGGSLERHDFIGDYLDFLSCDVLRDVDAIDCHPYSFKHGTNTWTYPEDPDSETWQIRNLAAWLTENQHQSQGILAQTRLWSTEYGFDSNPETGVGEKTHSAYLLRGLLLHSRYHYERVFFYNAYDVARPNDLYYNGLYNSSGFWRLGTHPLNNAWPSPLESHGATPKPAWYGMLDFKERFAGHVFYRALLEDNDAYVWLLAKPDGSDPCLVFWSPQPTTDANLNDDLTVEKNIQWPGILPGVFRIDSSGSRTFAENEDTPGAFTAFSAQDCEAATLRVVRRSPAFIRLVPCVATCDNITQPGALVVPAPGAGGYPYDPPLIQNAAAATGGSGAMQYQWQQSSDNTVFADIPGANDLSYDPPAQSAPVWFRRAAKRDGCPDFLFTPAVNVSAAANCPVIPSFLRKSHNEPFCNSPEMHYFELVVDQVTHSDQIRLEMLPANGLNVNASSLNGIPFTPAVFFDNLHYESQSELIWEINPQNGVTQTLVLYYCWANYPDPVSLTSATSGCSGVTVVCSDTQGRGETEDRSANTPEKSSVRWLLSPNPGHDLLTIQYQYSGASSQVSLRMLSASGQSVMERQMGESTQLQQWEIAVGHLPVGLYFLGLYSDYGVKWLVWEKK